MEELRLKVIDWAKDRGIMEKATPLSQCTKVMEECLELVVADLNNDEAEIKDAVGDILVTLFIEAELLGIEYAKIQDRIYAYESRVEYIPSEILGESLILFTLIQKESTEDLYDIIAYTIVTLLSYCKCNDLNPIECLQGAYDVISKRKGKMVNGVFVKDE